MKQKFILFSPWLLKSPEQERMADVRRQNMLLGWLSAALEGSV